MKEREDESCSYALRRQDSPAGGSEDEQVERSLEPTEPYKEVNLQHLMDFHECRHLPWGGGGLVYVGIWLSSEKFDER